MLIKTYNKSIFTILCLIILNSLSLEGKTLERENVDLLNKVIDLVDKEYIESTEQSELVEAAINGMLQSLDPHSVYLTPKDFANLQNDTSGEFGGIGIEVTMENGVIKVISPIDETPAQKAGMIAGDYITHINKEPIFGKNLNDAVDLMRGKPNTEVAITVVRKEKDDAFDITIIRDIIQIPGIKSEIKGKNNNIGYIRISAFNERTSEKLYKELYIHENNENPSIKGYILDLRRNPGGLLKQAIEVANMFLDYGEIVSTKRPRFEEKINSFEAKRGDFINQKPLIILVNGGSASASEIVAAALKDHRRAIVVGTKSFGKGSVQTVMPLREQSAMRLTTARYYSPSGRSIQNLGVTPDIIVEQPRRRTDDEEDRFKFRSESDLRGSLSNDSLSEDEIQQIEEDRAKAEKAAELRNADYQLAYAIDILTGLNALGPEK